LKATTATTSAPASAKRQAWRASACERGRRVDEQPGDERDRQHDDDLDLAQVDRVCLRPVRAEAGDRCEADEQRARGDVRREAQQHEAEDEHPAEVEQVDADFVETEQRTGDFVIPVDAGLLEVPEIGVDARAVREFARAEREQALVVVERIPEVEQRKHGDQREARDRAEPRARLHVETLGHRAHPRPPADPDSNALPRSPARSARIMRPRGVRGNGTDESHTPSFALSEARVASAVETPP
jgi:hypothetical protein